MPSSFRKMHKLGGDHLPTSTVTVRRSAAINLLWVPIISFSLLWRSVVPRGGNLTMENQGWGNWHLKTWKCQISLGLPGAPILGQTIDGCIKFSAFLSMLAFKSDPQFLFVINGTWADRHKYAGFSQNMLRHPFGYPSFIPRPLPGFSTVPWKNVRNGTFTFCRASPAKAKWLSLARTDVEYVDISRRSEHRRPWQNKIDFIFTTS